MQIVLVISLMGKKQALKIFSSDLLLISYSWNIIFVSSYWMTKPDDGRELVNQYLLSPALIRSWGVGADEFFAGGSAAFVSLPLCCLGFSQHMCQ